MAKIGQVKWVETSILHGDVSFFCQPFCLEVSMMDGL